MDGWIVGKENSFVTELSRKLLEVDIANEIVLKPYTILSKVNPLIEACKMEKPDVLILQYGNYEFSPSLINQIRKKLRKSKSASGAGLSKSKPNSHTTVSVVNPEKPYAISFKFRLTQFFKDLANKMIFYSWLNKSKWSNITDETFQKIYALNIPKVVLLSPFPTANKVTNIYRSQGAEILRTCGNRYNFHFINVLGFLKKAFPNKILTADEGHLNTLSHQAVGSLVFSETEFDCKFLLNKKVINQLSRK